MFFKLSLCLIAAAAQLSRADAFPSMWSATEPSRLRKPSTGNRVEMLTDGLTLSLDETLLNFTVNEDGDVYIPIVLATGVLVNFKLRETQVLHPDLAAQFPEIRTFSGFSVDHTPVLEADIDYSPVKGLRAFIHDPEGEFAVDAIENDGSRHYKSYRARDLMGSEEWSCGFKYTSNSARYDFDNLEVSAMSGTPVEYVFTIAVVANGQYSRFHGNKKSAILAEMTTVMNRVNGIFKRSLGVFFQLHPSTADLICLYPCNVLKNTADIIDQMDDFITGKGISLDSFDIGHSFTTGSGGLACLGSLCADWKTCGTTGLNNPTSDVFYVDYVSHEIGHQMNADHTFQDCRGFKGGYLTSVEPGSGSTIMGYAGLCGGDNVQVNSDPYFHPVSLKQMKAFIENAGESCGTKTVSTLPLPIALLDTTCIVPLKSPFQINFLHVDKSHPEYMYSIDSMTSPSNADYGDASIPRFRSWKPGPRAYRSFPNYYYIHHDIMDSVLDEVLPSKTTAMSFRGLIRNAYSDSKRANDGDSQNGFGSYSAADIWVHFDASIEPLSISREIKWVTNSDGGLTLRTGDVFTVTWDSGGTNRLHSRVQIMFAHGEIPRVPYDRIDYETDVADLEWQLAEEVDNTGTATIVVPSIAEVSMTLPAFMMIRSPSEGCFYFDMVGNINYNNVASQPNNQPTLSPRNGGTPSASDPPVEDTTTGPTSPPSPESYRGTDAPTTAPTSVPTVGVGRLVLNGSGKRAGPALSLIAFALAVIVH